MLVFFAVSVEEPSLEEMAEYMEANRLDLFKICLWKLFFSTIKFPEADHISIRC